MADKGLDSFVGGFLILLAVVGVVSVSRGQPAPAPAGAPGGIVTTAGAKTPSPQTAPQPSTGSTNIPRGPLAACGGTLISNETVDSGTGTLNLRVYYSSAHGGRNCAVATTAGSPGGARASVAVSLRLAGYDGQRWPRYARHRSPAGVQQAGAVYLDGTDRQCVRAKASVTPARGGQVVTVGSGEVGCE